MVQASFQGKKITFFKLLRKKKNAMFEITNPTLQTNHLRKDERAGQLRNPIRVLQKTAIKQIQEHMN